MNRTETRQTRGTEKQSDMDTATLRESNINL